MPLLFFYTPWKHKKTEFFLGFQGGKISEWFFKMINFLRLGIGRKLNVHVRPSEAIQEALWTYVLLI